MGFFLDCFFLLFRRIHTGVTRAVNGVGRSRRSPADGPAAKKKRKEKEAKKKKATKTGRRNPRNPVRLRLAARSDCQRPIKPIGFVGPITIGLGDSWLSLAEMQNETNERKKRTRSDAIEMVHE